MNSTKMERHVIKSDYYYVICTVIDDELLYYKRNVVDDIHEFVNNPSVCTKFEKLSHAESYIKMLEQCGYEVEIVQIEVNYTMLFE